MLSLAILVRVVLRLLNGKSLVMLVTADDRAMADRVADLNVFKLVFEPTTHGANEKAKLPGAMRDGDAHCSSSVSAFSRAAPRLSCESSSSAGFCDRGELSMSSPGIWAQEVRQVDAWRSFRRLCALECALDTARDWALVLARACSHLYVSAVAES
jgi:hypothetical protein